MDKDTKITTDLDFLVGHILAAHHRQSKTKWINLYPTADSDPAFHAQALDYLANTLQKGPVSRQDSGYLLSLYQKCLKAQQGNEQTNWARALDALGVFIRRLNLDTFLYEEKSDYDRAIFEVLRCFPREFLVSSLKTTKDYAVFHAIAKFLYKENELKTHATAVIARLTDDFLVDKSKMTTRMTPYIAKSILDEDVFKDLLSTALKLTKRSESNIETLIVFLENISFDVSKRAYSLLFEDLKEFLNAKEKEKTEKFHRVFKAVVPQVTDLAELDKIFNELAKVVQNNNQETVKLSGLQLMFFMLKLDNKELPKEWLKTLLATVTSSASLVTGDETSGLLLQEFRKLKDFYLKKGVVPAAELDDKDYATVKKLLTNATISKNSLSNISAVLATLLENNQEGATLNKEVAGIVEAAYQNQVSANIKAIIKLVTAYSGFISTLLNTSLYLERTENAKLEKSIRADLVALLDENAFVNMQKFYNKANHDELSNFAKVLRLNAKRLAKEVKQTDNKYRILCSTLVEILTHPLLTVKEQTEFFAKVEAKDFIYSAIVHGLFNKLYVSTEAELERTKVDKVRIVLDYVVKDLESITMNNEFTLELLWLANSERLNPNLKIRSLIEKRTAKSSELKEKVLTAIRDNYDYLKTFIFSKDGLFAQELDKSNTAVNLCSMLIKWGVFEFLGETKMFINSENYSDATELDKFEDSIKVTDFEGEVADYCGTLNKLGITETKLQQEEAKTNVNLAAAKGKTGKGPVKAPAGAAVKKGGKDTKDAQQKPKQQYMDAEELQKYKEDELRKRMEVYLRKVIKVLKKVLKFRQPEVTEEYFAKCHENLKELAQIELVRGHVEEVLYVLLSFAPYKPIVRSCDYLTRVYLCKLCDIQLEQEDIGENYATGFKILKDLEFTKTNAHYTNIVYEACQYILVSEDVDSKLKGNALAVIIKIGTTGDSSELGSEILQMMIDYLDDICRYPETQGLFNFLYEKFADKVIESLFSYLLDYNEDAKIICLNAIVSVEKPELIKNFERNIKLMILSLDEDQDIVKLSQEAIQKYKIPYTQEHVENFNFKEFVNTESNDSLEKFSKYSPEILKEVPGAAKIFIQHSIEAAEKLANNKEIKKMEEALFFLPTLLSFNLSPAQDFLPKIFEIFVEQYCVEPYPSLTEKTLEVGADIIRTQGKEKGDFILGLLEKYIDKKFSAQTNVTAIILMGNCAPYLKDKSKVKTICDKIVVTANSPSDHVKKNIARCLPDLIGFFQNPQKIVQDTLESMQVEKDINKMKGSAYLISGFVKGLGVKSAEELEVIGFLEQNVEGKKVSPNIKQAIICLCQALTENLGKLFEPYFLKMLQILMNFFGEQQEEIRLSSLKCTRVMMSSLSAFGVKQILPQLLKGIEEKTWRAKVASISVLGNMAFCAPKQLSACLPQIVPRLAQALSDPHPTVQEKGNLALKEIGSTITSPEISDISDILIKALSNPYEENKKGLEVLLKTQFVHYIDTASLSLIIPIIDYGLRNRDSNLRKNASQLIGSISNLIKSTKDLDPYLPMLINALKMAICDTIGDVRAIAAKACGSLCQKLGLEDSAKLILSIQEILESPENTSIDRAGAAQAMSEITYALGKDYIEKVFPVYLANTTSTQAHVKESYIGIFAFLPAIMEDEFEPYISDVVDNIIDTISDENETTRGLAIRVCKILIQRFGLKKSSILMDPAEAGLFSPNWRRRSSSVVLVGEMLEIIQRCERRGLTKDLEADYNDKYNRIITSLHILKFDPSEHVKHTANAIWKNFVENTPKTLKSILPMLIDKLMYILSEVEENVEMANTCIHEFGVKYAESMFKDIFAHLESKKKQNHDNSQTTNALCLLLDTLINSMNDDFVESRKTIILSLIHDLLITSDDYIRASACRVLQTMLEKCKHTNLIEEIVPATLEELEKLDESAPEYDDYLKFFDEIIEFELEDHLEYIGECLFKAPLTQYKIDIITNNAEAFAPEIYQDNSFANIINFLFGELLDKKYSDDLQQSILYCINQLSIHLDESKLSLFFQNCFHLIEPTNLKDNKQKVYFGLEVLQFYFQNNSHDFLASLPQILTNITTYLTSSDPKLIGYLNDILTSIFNSLDQEDCFDVIESLNQCIESSLMLGTKNEVTTIKAFSVEEGLDPYMHVVVKSLVYGPIDVFDKTLTTYEYLIDYTDKKVLEEYVLKLVGPLIRVAFYKYENEVKAKVITTILKFEEKGLSLLMFLPQLQTTFVRMIVDYNGEKNYLRSLVDGLNYIIDNTKKRDFLLNDILSKYFHADTESRKFAHLYCMYRVMKKNLKVFSKALLDKLWEKLQNVKDLQIGSQQNKYIARTYGVLTGLDVVNKQKDAITAHLDKLEGLADKDFLHFEKLMSLIEYCDVKVLEQFEVAQLEKKISGYLNRIKVKNNVLFALQDVKKLKDSNEKLRNQLGQAIVDNNNFRDIYNTLIRDEEIEEIIHML